MRTCRTLQARPCLEYHIKRCLAPCAGKVTQADYGAMINAVLLFLEGRTADVERELTYRMEKAAAAYNFEIAARLRDQLLAVRKIAEKQNIVTGSGDQDAVGMARSEIGVVVQIFFVRAGKLIGREHFLLQGSDGETDEAILVAFLQQYYHQATFIPAEILLPLAIASDDLPILEKWLSSKRSCPVHILTPQRGTKHDLVTMASGNAAKYLADEAERVKKANDSTLGAVTELGKYLGLAKAPLKMECFDISHIQGSETVASMVVFNGGVPQNQRIGALKSLAPKASPTTFYPCAK